MAGPFFVYVPSLLTLKQVHRVEFVVGVFLFEQLGVGSVLDDAAGVHHIQVIGVFHCTQSVSDNHRGAVLAQQLQRLLDERFLFGVK